MMRAGDAEAGAGGAVHDRGLGASYRGAAQRRRFVVFRDTHCVLLLSYHKTGRILDIVPVGFNDRT